MNKNLSGTEIAVSIILLAIMVAFRDDVRTMLLWLAVIGFPLSAGVYLLRWWLHR